MVILYLTKVRDLGTQQHCYNVNAADKARQSDKARNTSSRTIRLVVSKPTVQLDYLNSFTKISITIPHLHCRVWALIRPFTLVFSSK